MKTFTSTLLALGFTLALTAQKIEVRNESEKFSTGTQYALTTTIYANTKDDVESAWKSLLKDFKHEKVKSSKDELMADNILIKEWGNNPIDIYTVFTEDQKTKTVKMSVAFDLGGAYLKPSDDKYAYAEKMILDFALNMTKKPMAGRVKEAEKLVSKTEEEQKNLDKEKTKALDNITEYKKKIADTESAIKKNEENQLKKKAELETNKKVLEEAKKLLDGVN